MSRQPERLWRVEWLQGYGWPECYERRRTARNYATPEAAGRQVDLIRAWPLHHILLGVYVTPAITWEAVDPGDLPRPEPEEEP